jgi:hypothetical protein
MCHQERYCCLHFDSSSYQYIVGFLLTSESLSTYDVEPFLRFVFQDETPHMIMAVRGQKWHYCTIVPVR